MSLSLFLPSDCHTGSEEHGGSSLHSRREKKSAELKREREREEGETTVASWKDKTVSVSFGGGKLACIGLRVEKGAESRGGGGSFHVNEHRQTHTLPGGSSQSDPRHTKVASL